MHRASWLAAAAVSAVIAIFAEIIASLVLPAAGGRTAQLVGAAAHFQMFHALATMGLCALGWPRDGVAWLFFYGTLLFSGGLYLRAVGMPPLVLVFAALGGVVAVMGWLSLAWSSLIRPKA